MLNIEMWKWLFNTFYNSLNPHNQLITTEILAWVLGEGEVSPLLQREEKEPGTHCLCMSVADLGT